MRSTMQDIPLNISQILEYAAESFPAAMVHSFALPTAGDSTTAECSAAASDQGIPDPLQSPLPQSSYSYIFMRARAAAFAQVLRSEFDFRGDERIATFCTNCLEQLEILFAATGIGAVFQPVNVRFLHSQLRYTIRHGKPRIIVTSAAFADQLAPLLADSKISSTVRAVIVIGSEEEIASARRHIPAAFPTYSYEALLDGRSTVFHWPVIPEHEAAVLCYSTGASGKPKAVAYSHRSLYLQALQLCGAEALNIHSGDTFLIGVPLAHACSWGVPLAAIMAGCHLVFPGTVDHSAHLAQVIAQTQPTKAHGVPIIWSKLCNYYLKHPPHSLSLQEIFSGGACVAPALIDTWKRMYGTELIQAWGMTELLGIATIARVPQDLGPASAESYRNTQGRFSPLVRHRIVSELGETANPDLNVGTIQVRGHTVTGEYYNFQPVDADLQLPHPDVSPRIAERFTIDGWLDTGDVGIVGSAGYLEVKDHARDVIHAGGENIYGQQLEVQLLNSPLVKECAIIGYPNSQWGERPLAIVQEAESPKDPVTIARELERYLEDYFPSWMVPKHWAFVRSISKTPQGKFDKISLRNRLAAGELPVISTLPGANEP
ncbi:MAG: AMP-binding protein [Corynebacterium sp.]|nr:AMP-binding protein [Corynebacterium sp.]